MRRTFVFAAVLLAPALTVAGQTWQYPPAPTSDVVDSYFGVRVADPYRSLEELGAPTTKAWVDAENALTFGYLATLARRDSIRARLTALWNYPRVTVPQREAGRLWFRKNSGLQKQSVLYQEAGAGGQGRAASAEPTGVGMANDGTTPLVSGVGVTKQVGEGSGPHLPPTRTPHDGPNGR
jgi:prolyl oligopeptidase